MEWRRWQHGSLVVGVLAVVLGAGSAWAHCSQTIIPQAAIKPAMERLYAKLGQTNKVYAHVSGKKLILANDFDALTGPQKLAALEPLRLGYAEWTPDLLLQELTGSERAKLPRQWDIYFGAMSPYEVYTADGTLVSIPYDGCTRFVALTEQARFRVLWNRPQPRTVHFPIAPGNEKAVKDLFWRFLGYNGSRDYWIGWVPERGYFEIDVPDSPAHRFMEALKPFWVQAPASYKYVVYSNDGTKLYTHTNGQPDAPREYVEPADDAPRGWARWKSL